MTIPADIMIAARSLAATVECVPSEGNIATIARAILAERKAADGYRDIAARKSNQYVAERKLADKLREGLGRIVEGIVNNRLSLADIEAIAVEAASAGTTPAPSVSKVSSAKPADLSTATMVERMAQAIYDAPTSFDGDTVATHLGQSMMIDASSRNADEMLGIVRSVCRDAASAALQALREPTPEMVAAVLPYVETPDDIETLRLAERAVFLLEPKDFPASGHADGVSAAKDVIRDHRRMIDAALSEVPS